MKIIGKMERKFGKYAIPNITLYLIIGYVTGYILELFTNVMDYLTLVPSLVMKGQVWRLFTWVITPPSSLSLFTIIMLLFYYSIGNQVERSLGTFLYNLYIFGGMFFTMLGTMIAYIFCHYVIHYEDLYSNSYQVSTYYICMSLFLAVAVCYPDMKVYYMMIIPVKMKWLAIVYLLLAVYSFYYSPILGRVNIVMSLLNFIIFYFSSRDYRRISPKNMKRKRNYTKEVKINTSQGVTHKCAVCGITDKEAPNMQFRYCSKCKGNKEYCQDHLFTHTHV